ncbi:hypothetical protein K9N68_13745 [Kovacikia minuta CCNUW1]|uniref:hypothetical protein n=1 Tax=Kovacikia minuta TaxID=2931930 RepID=UPI001CCA2658|nr:hypothetical protein [Kovacikia minuta]UBF28805.1 hypothetical protein K9N68_13745 [Kovacikia minuta CCNUW1]
MAIPDISEAIQNFEIAQQLLPIWTDWGVPDVSCSIHSLGVSFFTLLGQTLGYISVSEFPVPRQGQYATTGDDVRCDSIWFDQQTRTPILIAEFERYTGAADQKKLEGKVTNLLLAHHRTQDLPRWLILAYWTEGLVSLPSHARLHQIIKQGFETSERLKVVGTHQGRLLCLQFINELDTQRSLKLSKILQRGSYES